MRKRLKSESMSANRKIVLGVTTFNRKSILKASVASLLASGLDDDCEIRVYDDASTEYSIEDLKKILPTAVYIHVQKKNIGADANIRYMYKDFHAIYGPGDIFINCDSDLLYAPGWLKVVVDNLEKAKGILSAFNAITHPTIGLDGIMAEKLVMGSAGTAFFWNTIDFFLRGITDESVGGFDVQWNKYLRSAGFKLYCLQCSVVQHIGFEGFNSSGSSFDYGRGFNIGTLANGQTINNVIEWTAEMKMSANRRFWYALFPFANVRRGAKVVLYGAGNVAQDYIAQIGCEHYCNIVAVVDRKPGKLFSGGFVVQPVESLLELDFDQIVLSVREEATAKSIMNDLRKLDGRLVERAIFAGANNIIRL